LKNPSEPGSIAFGFFVFLSVDHLNFIGKLDRCSNDRGLAQRRKLEHSTGVIEKFSGFMALVFGLLSVESVRADDAVSKASPAKVVVIPIREQIAKPELFILRRGLKEAIENKADTIVLDMETPGGALNVTFEMLKALEKFPGKTVTYINTEAISAGALIAAGTDEIYFAPGSLIGAAAPVSATGEEIDPVMREKIVSYLKARVRSISEGKGYRGEVISAMIDLDSEFKIGDEVIKEKGDLLSLTANEATKTYGDLATPLLGTAIAATLDDLLIQLHGAGNYTIEKFEVTWSEKVAQYLTMITPILMGIGLLLLFIEFKTPGFGIFGVGGLAILATVFLSQFVAGLSGHEPMLFFFIGVILLAVEIFFIPGGMVLGLAGGTLMLGSLVWSMADLWPNEPISISGDVFLGPLLSVVTGVILAIVLFLAILRFLPRGGLWGNMVLNAAVAGGPGFAPPLTGSGTDRDLVGLTGIAATPLFPSGQVEVGGCRYEARLAMGFADAGTQVRVVSNNRLSLTVEVIS
jgi:membrane-bound serine protease (ClpP class)